jgi:hypothetical protein
MVRGGDGSSGFAKTNHFPNLGLVENGRDLAKLANREWQHYTFINPLIPIPSILRKTPP